MPNFEIFSECLLKSNCVYIDRYPDALESR